MRLYNGMLRVRVFASLTMFGIHMGIYQGGSIGRSDYGRSDYEQYDCSATYGTIVGAKDGKHCQRHSKAVVSSHTFFMTIA